MNKSTNARNPLGRFWARFATNFLLGILLVGIWTGFAAFPLGGRAEDGKDAALSNIKFPLGFSVSKMDTRVAPGKDFHRFAAGKWLDAAKPTPEFQQVSDGAFLDKQVQAQLKQILLKASTESTQAKKGSPLQQVGDLYVSGLDEKRLTALGVKPLKPIFDQIDAIASPETLAKTLADLSLTFGGDENVLFGIQIGGDIRDQTVNTIYFADRGLPISQSEYLNQDTAKIRAAYLKSIVTTLEVAGDPPSKASTTAQKILEMESRIASKKLSPVERQDLNLRFKKMPFSGLQTLLSNFDVKTYFQRLGLPTQGNVTVLESQALAELNQMVKDYPMEDIKTYLRWSVLFKAKPYLTPALLPPGLALVEARYGKIKTPSRPEVMVSLTPKLLGHPLSQLYVKDYFAPEYKQQVASTIQRIKTIFRARLEANTWLSAPTRKAALDKLNLMVLKVGYPDQWIDYSSVDIRRDDYFGNVVRIKKFLNRRNLALIGKPTVKDDFNEPESTLPTVLNAAYNSTNNDIQIAAAYLQPPNYNPKADAAVNFCTIGAVIGHEITHGFDSQGRLFNGQGNFQNWWTEQDAAKFEAQTDKLVKQADAYEVLPGLKLNGKLTVGENLADVGGVSLAYEALQQYLQENPTARKTIDGYTPEQRCFIAWSQLWASKSNEGLIRQITATDAHPVGAYRGFAPFQHEAGFFKAFGIKPGDPMWLDEKDRVKLW